MEPDDLCSRNARPQKDGKGVARCHSKGGVTSKFGGINNVAVRCAHGEQKTTPTLKK